MMNLPPIWKDLRSNPEERVVNFVNRNWEYANNIGSLDLQLAALKVMNQEAVQVLMKGLWFNENCGLLEHFVEKFKILQNDIDSIIDAAAQRENNQLYLRLIHIKEKMNLYNAAPAQQKFVL